MNYPGLLLNGSSSAICFDLCLTHGPVRLHHAIFLNITQPKGTNLKIYPMHEFKTLNSSMGYILRLVPLDCVIFRKIARCSLTGPWVKQRSKQIAEILPFNNKPG